MCSLSNQFMRNSTSFDSKYSHTRCFDLFFFLLKNVKLINALHERRSMLTPAKVLNEYNWQREIVIQICA